MRNVLEYDHSSDLISDLGFDQANMYKEADSLVNLELAEELNKCSLSFYQDLMDKKQQVSVRFSGLRKRNSRTYGKREELFVIFDTIELVYHVEPLYSQGDVDAKLLLEKEYKVFVTGVNEEKRRVYVSDYLDATRKVAFDLINKKLDEGQEVFLRGNIIGLQNERMERNHKLAAYVNIEGLGIIGVIPIKQWSVGYSVLETFQSTILNNVNAIVNFKVVRTTRIKYGSRSKIAFLCSRSIYLEREGYDPWKIVSKTLTVRSVVKVRIIEEGKSPESFFAAIDGISDFNMLCYVSDKATISLKDISVGKYYYGYVQKLIPERKFLRVRLTSEADQGSHLKLDDSKKANEK